jgi:multiple sugar transport system substrate-binding protein
MSRKWFLLLLVLLMAMMVTACEADTTATTPPVVTAEVALPATVEVVGEDVIATSVPAVDEPAPTEEVMEEPAPTDEVVEEPAPTTGDVVQLQLMGWSSSDAENSRLQEMIDTFNDDNPDINVQLNLNPQFDTALQTALAGGQPPDVFYIDSFRLPDLVAANALMPIGDQLENPDDFYPNLRQAFTVDDTFWCPPKDFSTLALQYNTDLFDAAGVDYPTADWTWDDLQDAAERLTDADNSVYGMVLSPDLARWIAFLYQAGGSVTNEDFTAMTLDTPEAQEAMEFYLNMVNDGYAAQPSDLDSGWPGEAFGRGQAAMAMEGNWMVSYLNDQFPDLNWGVTELPAGPAGDATMSFTVCYGVPAAAANPEASIRLVNFLTGPEGMAQWSGLGLAMPTRASLSDSWLEQYPDLEPFLAGAQYSYPWQFRPGFQDVLDTINAGLQQAFTGTYLPEQVLEEAQEVGNQVLGSQ